MNVREVNEEVLYANDPIVSVVRADVTLLKQRANTTGRKRIRLCAHESLDDIVHEMLIVHARHTYVRPHKHLGKSESFHVVEGRADVVVFNDDGGITDVIELGDYASGRVFFYRLPASRFHTLLVRSDVFVFHETTRGPFRPADTVFASWAPAEDDEARAGFVADLEERVGS